MVKVVVLHPDLGLGGAERLIIDACRALQDSGHQVTIYTGFYDAKRCFEETKDGTLTVKTIASWLPRNILGRFHAVMAYLKMILIAAYVVLFSKHDLVICDQVSACIPILKLDLRNRSKIIFYCHFPDKLLTSRDSILKALYRAPIDFLEETSTRLADRILVNSKFTGSVVRRTFKSFKDSELTVLYPCVDVNKLRARDVPIGDCGEQLRRLLDQSEENFMFLSLNRFERKKNLGLAIEAMSECVAGFEQNNPGGHVMKAHLIIAGGYDKRLGDCLQYYEELASLVETLKLGPYVTFVKSPSDAEKLMLLQLCHAVVYTPENEHFGIVPLEAMAMSKPVIASATGGPLETVEDDVTGYLCETDKYSFADAMLKLHDARERAHSMGCLGLKRVLRLFSYEAFRDQLDKICKPLIANR